MLEQGERSTRQMRVLGGAGVGSAVRTRVRLSATHPPVRRRGLHQVLHPNVKLAVRYVKRGDRLNALHRTASLLAQVVAALAPIAVPFN